jgi:hypothetical protein
MTKAKKQNLGLCSPPKNWEAAGSQASRSVIVTLSFVLSPPTLRQLARFFAFAFSFAANSSFTLSAIASMSRHPLLSPLSLRCHRQLKIPEFWSLENSLVSAG